MEDLRLASGPLFSSSPACPEVPALSVPAPPPSPPAPQKADVHSSRHSSTPEYVDSTAAAFPLNSSLLFSACLFLCPFLHFASSASSYQNGRLTLTQGC